MSEHMIWELIGYLGSALVLVSLLMSSIVKLRVINAIGSLIFCIYAFKINSIPTAVMNMALVGIDLYFLIKLSKPQQTFSVVAVSADDASVRQFLGVHNEDIKKYFESTNIRGADNVYVVFDKDTMAGISAGKVRENGLELMLDYTTPQYRDCKVAAYLYSVLADSFETLSYTGCNKDHIAFLDKMGYVKESGAYVKKLR